MDFSALTIRKKLVIGFGAVVLIFALAGGYSSLTLNGQREAVAEILTNDLPMIEALQKTIVLVQLYRKAEKDVLLNIGDKKAQAGYMAKLNELSAQTKTSLELLDKVTQTNEDLPPDVRKLPSQAKESFLAYDKVVLGVCSELVGENGNRMTALEANALFSKSKDSVHKTEKSLEALYSQAMTMLGSNQQTMSDIAKQTQYILLFAIISGAVASIGLGGTVLLSITRPLGRVMVFADAVAKGDINARAAGTFTAEMAELNASIEAMLETLKGKIAEADNKTAEAAEGTRLAKQATEEANAAKAQAEQAKTEGMMQAAVQLEQVVQVVGTASKDLSSQIRQSSNGTEVQSQRVAETATAMEEMNATVLEVAKSAAQASDSSNEARQKALEGAGVVAEVVAGISSVQTVSLVMKDDMLVLGKQADGIGTIMNVISDIADQTNLLALNAAIEAARAGDAGRGFAVVADEVRKLAEKTMVATQEVGQAISGIQQGTTKNLQNVERAVGSIEQATSLANKSGEALQEIVRLVEVSSDQVRSIATASEQQSAASEEINHSIEEINRISSETAGSMAQSSRSVADLSTQVDNLRRLIDTMKRGG